MDKKRSVNDRYKMCKLSIVLFLLLCNLSFLHCQPHDISKRVEFRTELETSFEHIAIDQKKDGFIYIGASNYLFQLTDDLLQTVRVSTGPRSGKDNINKILLVDSIGARLVVCGSTQQGICELRSLNDIHRTLYSPNFTTLPTKQYVAANGNLSTVAFIASDPTDNLTYSLYVGSSKTMKGSNINSDPPFYTVSKRKLLKNNNDQEMFSLSFSDGFIWDDIGVLMDKEKANQGFRVNFIDGFALDKTGYFISTHPSPSNEAVEETYISQMCLEEPYGLRSYLELPLSCTANRFYTKAVASRTVKVGSKLAQSLGIPTNFVDQVVFISFVNPNQLDQGSAVCAFPLRVIEQKFLSLVKRCMKGGSPLAEHISWIQKVQSMCGVGNFQNIQSPVCYNEGLWDIAQYLQDENLYTNTAVYTSSEIITSIESTVTQSKKDTVAFFGTQSGKMLKVQIDSNNRNRNLLYDTVVIDTSQESFLLPEDGPDLSVAVKSLKIGHMKASRVYAVTSNAVVGLPLYNCSKFLDCKACLTASDPFCGWLTLESRCSKMVSSTTDYRFIPSDGQCPSLVVDGSANSSIETKQKQVYLKSYNIPQTENSNTNIDYFCTFGDSIYPPRCDIKFVNKPGFLPLNCCTPPSQSISIPPGQTSLNLPLSLRYNSGSDSNVVVTTGYTFYDCSAFTSCLTCISSGFKCQWCMYQKICSDSDLSQCGNRIQVINENGNCPSQQGFTENGHVVGSTTYLAVDSRREVRVRTRALPRSSVSRYECEIERPDGGGIPVVVPGNQQGKDIVCRPFTINLDGKQRSSIVGLKVIWINIKNQQRQPLDNPNSLQIEVYRCSLPDEEDNCGTCRSSSEHWKCGWCRKSGNCSLYDSCSLPSDHWIPATPGRVCTHPKINKFYPLSAPIHTSTSITIQGINFNVRNNMEITMAGWNCTDIEPVQTDGCCTLTCSVRPNRINEGQIKLCITDGQDCMAGPSYNTESEQKLLFVDPKITKFTPTTVLQGWGTRIKFMGKHLNAGNSVTVTIMDRSCVVDRSTLTSDQLECVVQWSETSRRRRHSLSHRKSSDMLRHLFRKKRASATPVVWPILLSFNGFQKTAPFKLQMHSIVKFKSMSPNTTLLSGGIPILLRGSNLGFIQKPMITVVKGKHIFNSSCDVIGDQNAIRCVSPDISHKIFKAVDARVVITSQLGGLPTAQLKAGVLHYKANPRLFVFEGEGQTKVYRNGQLYIEGTGLCADRLHCDITTVRIILGGNTQCNVTRLDFDQVACQPPPDLEGKHTVEVRIGGYSKQVGYLEYEEDSQSPVEIIVVFVIGTIIAVVVVVIICIWRSRKIGKQSEQKVKDMQMQMNMMESKVAKVCKEAFAELQTDMTDYKQAMGRVGIPYLDYRIYLMRVLFPDPSSAKKQHNLLLAGQNFSYDGNNDSRTNSNRPLPPHGGRSIGMSKFDKLLENKCFLMCFIRTIESKSSFSMKDKSMVAGLLLVIFQNRLQYATEILEQLLADLIRKNMEGKTHPKLLLRRTESVAEKMLTHWLSILLYRFVNECAGEPLFMLYRAIKQQVDKGPLDMFTNEARYSLGEDKLLRQTVEHVALTLHVTNYLAEHDQSDFTAKVLSCDSISQAKRKILDISYMNVPYSHRPPPDSVDLEWRQGRLGDFILRDEDATNKVEGEWKQVNTLAHYSVGDGAAVSVIPRTENTLNQSTISGHSRMSRQNGSGARLLPMGEGSNSSLPRYRQQQSRSGTPTLPQDGSKLYHLVRQRDQEQKEGGESKMVSEIYLTRLLTTKGTIQKYVDDLFEAVFSTMQRGHALPMAVKHIFDFLDHQADIHGVTDPEIVHTWKNNCLPLRFWVNLIKNPNFVFDIHRSPIMDCYLSVIAQAFMDSCSTAEYKLSHESPSNKLLYAKDIPTYRKWVEKYYADVSNMPKLNARDMSLFLGEESYVHTNDFNTHEALSQLYKYVEKYSDDILLSLDSDKEARRQRLLDRLEQVSASMNGYT